MAAAYAFHIAENQPFVDGNKRTALNAALVFLDLNGFIVHDPEGRLHDAMIAISSRALDKRGSDRSSSSWRSPTRADRANQSFRVSLALA